MAQKNTAVIGFLVAVVAGVSAYTLWPGTTHAPSDSDAKQNEENSTLEKPKPAPTTAKPNAPTPSSPPVTRGGTYESYTSDAVGYAALGEVVLYFHSPSCPACVLLDKDILVNATKIPKDVKILKVDYDTSPLKQQFGLSTPHVLIQVDSKGSRITQWALSSTLSDLLTRVVRF